MVEETIKDVLKQFFNGRKIIIICFILFLLIGILKPIVVNGYRFTSKSKENYITGFSVILKNEMKYSNINSSDNSINFKSEELSKFYMSTEMTNVLSNILKSSDNLDKIIKDLNLNIEKEELVSKFVLYNNNDIVSLNVVDTDKDQSIALCNYLKQNLEEAINQIFNIQEIVLIQDVHILENYEIDENSENINNLSKEEVYSNKSFLKNVIVFSVFGIVIGLVIVLGKNILEDDIKNENEIVNIFKLNELIKIDGKNDHMDLLSVKLSDLKNVIISSYEDISNNDKYIKNLLVSIANRNEKIICVDLIGNVSKEFSINKKSKFISIKEMIQTTNNKNLQIINLDSNENYNQKQITDLINELDLNYDHVIIISNNILNNSNSYLIAKVVKEVIIEVQVRKTKGTSIYNTINQFNQDNINIYGAIVIDN